MQTEFFYSLIELATGDGSPEFLFKILGSKRVEKLAKQWVDTKLQIKTLIHNGLLHSPVLHINSSAFYHVEDINV